MDTGKHLSSREQRILTEIEENLRQDRKLDDRLRNLRLPARLRLLSMQQRLRGMELGLLVPTTLVLALSAAHTARLGVIIAAGCVGAITLLLLADTARSRAKQRRMERLAAEDARRQTSP